MRIIAGDFRGRRLGGANDPRVRFTTDRVREAWFNILAPALRGARVLDLFAGSGVLGLEALSRGAEHADFVEITSRSVAAIRANIQALGVSDRTTVYCGDAVQFAERLEEGAYDIALADPPYTTDQASQLLEVFRTRAFAQVLGVEHSAATRLSGDETRRYGDIALTFLYST